MRGQDVLCVEQGGEADVRILNAEDRILAPHVRCKEWYPAPGAPKRAVQNRLGWERWSRLKFTQGVNVMSVPASNVRARKARKGDEQFYRQVDTCNFFICSNYVRMHDPHNFDEIQTIPVHKDTGTIELWVRI